MDSFSNVMQSWVAGIARHEIEEDSLLKYKDLFVQSGTVFDVTTAMQQWVSDVTATGMPTCASLKLPAGKFKLSAPIVINTGNRNLSIHGEGTLASQFVRDTDYGDTFILTTCPQISFRDFGIQMSVEMTHGAHFNCQSLYRATFDNLYLTEPFVGILLKNCSGVLITNTVILGAKYFTDIAYKPGSALVKLEANSAGANNGIAISNCSFDPSSLTPATGSKYQYSIWCESVDGVWITNSHIAGGSLAHVGIKPVLCHSLIGIRLSNSWIDFHAVRCVEVLADGIQPVQNISLNGCLLQGATGKGLYVNSPYLDGLTVTGCTLEFNALGAGAIYAGKNISISGNVFKGNNGGAISGSTLMLSTAGTSNVAISGNIFDAGPSVSYHINTGSIPPSTWLQTGNVFAGAAISNIYIA